MQYFFAVVQKDSGSAYGVSFPDLPGCFSAADKLEDVVSNAIEAIELWFESQELIEPRSIEAIRAKVGGDLAEGAFLIAVPWLEKSQGHARCGDTEDNRHRSAIWEHDISRWVIENAVTLSERSRFCAQNSLKFAIHADALRSQFPAVATFCALHAQEEAVAAFIWAAKSCGNKARAGKINIRDHQSKALVSIMAARVVNAVVKERLAITVAPDGDGIAYRVRSHDGLRYGVLHLSSFYIDVEEASLTNDLTYLGTIPRMDEINAEVNRAAELRNATLYASKKGMPTGFIELQKDVESAIKMALGLIWASIDLHSDPEQGGPFVATILDTMIQINEARPKK